MKKLYIPLIAATLTHTSCRKLGFCHDTEFSIKKTAYTGTQLRTDGFYYGKGDTDYIGTVRCDVLIFYKNGILMFPGSPKEDSMEEYMTISHRKNVSYGWGLFIIEGTTIKTERRPPTFAGCAPMNLMTGQILNDTTFILTSSETRKNKGKSETTEISEQYFFRQFGTKPDSTNDVVK